MGLEGKRKRCYGSSVAESRVDCSGVMMLTAWRLLAQSSVRPDGSCLTSENDVSKCWCKNRKLTSTIIAPMKLSDVSTLIVVVPSDLALSRLPG